MRNFNGGLGVQGLLMAETLGLEMARQAERILAKHRDALTRIGPGSAGEKEGPQGESAAGEAYAEILNSPEFQADNAIFTAILDAANECLGRFDHRPPEQRWCDALLQVLELADLAPAVGVSAQGLRRFVLLLERHFDLVEAGMAIGLRTFDDEISEYYEDEVYDPEACDCERCAVFVPQTA